MKAREIFKSLGIIEAWLEESMGEITPEIEALTEELGENIEDFISWAVPVIKDYQGQADAKKAYAAEVAASGKALGNKGDRLVNLIDVLMQHLGKDRVETVEGTVSYRKSTPLIIDNEGLIPAEFWDIKEVKSVDKAAIKKALKEREVTGVHLEEKQNIQIKG